MARSSSVSALVKPSRALAPIDRWGVVLMFGDDCLQDWSALGVAQARLPRWRLTGYAVGSSRPPSRRKESSSPAGNGIWSCSTSPDRRAWQGSLRPVVGIPGFRNTGTPSGENTIDLGCFELIAVRGWRKSSSQARGWRLDARAAQATPCQDHAVTG